MQQQSVQLGDTAATQDLGRRLALDWLALPQPKPILLLEGDLGAGKTSLVQGIALGLGIDEPITSPTFALAQHYRGQAGALVHLDLYRLEHSASADELFCQEEEEAQALGALMAESCCSQTLHVYAIVSQRPQMPLTLMRIERSP